MPDDKIHLELQGEELALLRKQAAAAGVDNLSDFARQKLVSLLQSLEQSGLHDASKEAIEKVRTELKRLHSEIQDFVAETAAAASPELEETVATEKPESETPVNAPFTPPFPFARPFGIPGLGLGGSAGRGFPLGLPRQRPAFGPNKPADELEEMAGKAFSISPRLKTDEGNPPEQKPPAETNTFNAAPIENPQWPTQPAQPVLLSQSAPQIEVEPFPTPPVELPTDSEGEEPVAVDPELLNDDPLGDLLDKALLEKKYSLDASALSALAGEITVAADQTSQLHEPIETAEELPPKPDNVIQAQFWDDAENSEPENVSSTTNTVKEEEQDQSPDSESVQNAQNDPAPSDSDNSTPAAKPKISGISGNIPPKKRRS